MATEAINNYITKRYERWLDYSRYHCGKAGIPYEASDVLNETLYSLLQKPDSLLTDLLSMKNGNQTGLDYFVLKMIKRNVLSPTSQYQNKYKPFPTDENTDYTRLEIEEFSDEPNDRSAEVLAKFRKVREIFENLNLSPLAARVFEFHFFQDRSFREWKGKETRKQLYAIYNGVHELIYWKISGESIF